MADTITVAELQHDARRVLNRIQRQGKELVVTQRGRQRAVLVSVRTLERSRWEIEQLRMLALVEAGRRAVAEGRTQSSQQVRQAFKRLWAGARRAER